MASQRATNDQLSCDNDTDVFIVELNMLTKRKADKRSKEKAPLAKTARLMLPKRKREAEEKSDNHDDDAETAEAMGNLK